MAAYISAACLLCLLSLMLAAVATSPDPELITFASFEEVGTAPPPWIAEMGKSKVYNLRIVKAGAGGISYLSPSFIVMIFLSSLSSKEVTETAFGLGLIY